MKEFFFSPDWLNRSGPWAYTLEHFLFIFIVIGLGLLAAILLRRCSKKTVHIVLISIWAFLIVLEIFKCTVVYTRVAMEPEEYPFDIETMLSLHCCSMYFYVAPIAMFSKRETLRKMAFSFLVCVNMIMGFITLFVGFAGKEASVFSFFGLHFLIFHALIAIGPLIMLVTNYYDIKKEDIKYGLLMFGILAVIIYIFDWIAKCDYFFIFDGHTFGVFAFIYENVPHIVWTLIIISCYIITAIATHYLVLGIKYLVNKKIKKEQIK